MEINSLSFLIFFVIVFGLYYLPYTTYKAQNVLLLLSSLFFYGYVDWHMLLLLVASILLFFFLGRQIPNSTRLKAKLYTLFAVFLGTGLLLYFKYLNFFLDGFANLFATIGLQVDVRAGLEILLPLGISFFTFRLISYIIDVKRGDIKPGSLIDFAVYVSFFPCILSGPIDRAVTFIPQIQRERLFNYSLSVEGCRQILWGMFKKMVVADGLSLFVSKDVASCNGSTLLIVSILYSVQIYADFSGYSDMVIGVGKLLGIRITRNFRYPYFSRNVAEFWNRWHMSLLSWFRHYIYFPLGGGRVSKMKIIRNTFVIFLVSGLWHGANWTFVIWGLFHALLFVPSLLSKNRKKYKDDTPYVAVDIFRCLLVFVLITIGWIIFRSEDMTMCVACIKEICSCSLFEKPSGLIWALPSIIFSVFMFVLEWNNKEKEFPLAHIRWNRLGRWSLYLVLVLAIVFYQGKPADFIYFKF